MGVVAGSIFGTKYLNWALGVLMGGVAWAGQPDLDLGVLEMEVPDVRDDASVRFDYDVVYVRAPRVSGDEGRSLWAEIAHPSLMDAGADGVVKRRVGEACQPPGHEAGEPEVTVVCW